VAAQEAPIILVIEDDQQIQVLVEDALREGGFEPTMAGSGEEAITLLNGVKGKYRALVTDINLAGSIDGWRVARATREVDPNFPVIYMTGAAADDWGSKGVPNSILLKKPFAPAQITAAVAQLLNTGSLPA
jgi:DNA-binding response OmpR family regulator